MINGLLKSIDALLAGTRTAIERAVAGEPKYLVIVLGTLGVIMLIFHRLLRIKDPP